VAGVHLPQVAKLLFAESVGFQDTEVWAVVRMPASALDGFLSDGKLPKPESGLRTVADSFGAGPGLDPKTAVKVSGIDQFDTGSPEGYHRKAMFDLDKPDEVTVYLVATTT
jgi:hypothetical protein